MTKFESFFSNKVTKIVAFCVMTLAIVFLLAGGITGLEISQFLELVLLAIAAIGDVIAFICSIVKKE